MIHRPEYIRRINGSLDRAPITALLGPRQCGKTTLARLVGVEKQAHYFDLESPADQRRLQNPELMLGSLSGLVILDEIQTMPELFTVLRVMVDKPESSSRYLILGSASPNIVKNVSETMAGRVEFIELSGFDLLETGEDAWRKLWLRGGFPRSFLARTDADSQAWRAGFIRTFLERDIPNLGITIPAVAMRRFWTMLSHYHSQIWNGSELGRAMGMSDKTVRSYLDLLTGTYMVRQLQPWHENLKKRQIKSPKVYLRDQGILHTLMDIPDFHSLTGHPKIGASWEGFVMENLLQIIQPSQAYFWATHSGAELDLLLFHHGRRYGVEIKYSDAPAITRSMRVAQADLRLDHLLLIYPGLHRYPMDEAITAIPITEIGSLPALLGGSK
jgi:predicted AAA+ superfamily ATPase